MTEQSFIITLIDFMVIALFPLSLICCGAGFFLRKTEPHLISMGGISLLVSLFLALFWSATKGFFALNDAMLSQFQVAIRDQKAVSYEGIIPESVFSISQYWWVMLATFLALIFVPFFRGRVRKG